MTNVELDIYQKIGKALKEIRLEKKLTLQQIEKMSDNTRNAGFPKQKMEK